MEVVAWPASSVYRQAWRGSMEGWVKISCKDIDVTHW